MCKATGTSTGGLTDGKERVPVDSRGFPAAEQQRRRFAALQEAGVGLGKRQPLQLLRQGRHGLACRGKDPPKKPNGREPRPAGGYSSCTDTRRPPRPPLQARLPDAPRGRAHAGMRRARTSRGRRGAAAAGDRPPEPGPQHPPGRSVPGPTWAARVANPEGTAPAAREAPAPERQGAAPPSARHLRAWRCWLVAGSAGHEGPLESPLSAVWCVRAETGRPVLGKRSVQVAARGARSAGGWREKRQQGVCGKGVLLPSNSPSCGRGSTKRGHPVLVVRVCTTRVVPPQDFPCLE